MRIVRELLWLRIVTCGYIVIIELLTASHLLHLLHCRRIHDLVVLVELARRRLHLHLGRLVVRDHPLRGRRFEAITTLLLLRLLRVRQVTGALLSRIIIV